MLCNTKYHDLAYCFISTTGQKLMRKLDNWSNKMIEWVGSLLNNWILITQVCSLLFYGPLSPIIVVFIVFYLLWTITLNCLGVWGDRIIINILLYYYYYESYGNLTNHLILLNTSYYYYQQSSLFFWLQ